ncbi:MAG: tRNA pseudouridine(38-40) synthase TruA [Bacteroidota bacterium]|nr:tRNA pseudouridine(38-40) synthase TruA [Bacteroidota bacterium]MDP4232379.1 tRNA pseudouridine(38-40) synthase TruA [Bacteroidota bacterium]MDP4241516.1 tRNA pseudouridine(38-40) synthase TruA [Bacteroidota bacterium]MDP4288250.1 tRNA pseudouridine(38-40) synthase TruA [Bacteroidota bacterium]
MKTAIRIEYDGTEFSGWQVQENGRSVQGEIEHAFRQLFGVDVAVLGAGRTDAGVHAHGMVAHAELPVGMDMTLNKLIIALNATTPEDIVIHDVRAVPEDFHARHSALARQYHYRIRRERTAIDRNVVWAIRRDVDAEKMQFVTAMLIGEHDFTSFSKRTNDVNHYRCLVEYAGWRFHGTSFALTIRANRFVRGMVRALVGAIVQVGQGMLEPDAFEGLLHRPQEFARAKYIAPAHGLVLEGIEYPERFGLWALPQMTNNE